MDTTMQPPKMTTVMSCDGHVMSCDGYGHVMVMWCRDVMWWLWSCDGYGHVMVRYATTQNQCMTTFVFNFNLVLGDTHIHCPPWPNPTLAATNSPLNLEPCHLGSLLRELLLQPRIWIQPYATIQTTRLHFVSIPHIWVARGIRRENLKADSYWWLNPGLQEHLCRTSGLWGLVVVRLS